MTYFNRFMNAIPNWACYPIAAVLFVLALILRALYLS